MQIVESAKIVLPNQAGRILIVQRAFGDVKGGEWDLLGGGLEPGESAIDAACREVREEADLPLPPSAFLPLHTTEGLSRSRPDTITRYHYFVGNVAVGEGGKTTLIHPDPPIRLSSEHSSYRWAPPEEAVQLLLHPRTRMMLGRLAAGGVLDDVLQLPGV